MCRCSLAYGTPLQIQRAQHDVPIPSWDNLGQPSSSSSESGALDIFIALVTLTEVLGHYLEHIHSISKSFQPFKMTATDLEQLLLVWEEYLGSNIRRVVLRGTGLSAPGAANLRLSYLAVKLLLAQLYLDQETASPQHLEANGSSRYMQAQRIAEEIVHFTQELDESSLIGFWLPLNAHTLTSATNFLLRSALQQRDVLPNVPLDLAKDMISTLQAHRSRYSWDLANDCLATCGNVLERIQAGSPPGSPTCPNVEEFLDIEISVLDDLHADLGTGFDFDFEL